MNLLQLRAFDAVARERSFTRAAARLCVSQPAVTAHVRALEAQYGVALFHRRGRGVEPTEAGERLAAISHRLFAAAGEAEALLAAHRALETGRLTLAADAPHVAMPLLAAFRCAYPQVHVTLALGNARETRAQLYAERCEVAVLVELPPDPAVCTELLSRQPIVAFVPRTHPWCRDGRASVRIAEFDGAPMAMREPASATRATFEAACRAHAVQPRIALELASREAVKEAVAAGLGIGVVSAAELGSDPRFHALRFADVELVHTHVLACLAHRRELRTVRACFGLVAGAGAAAG